VEPPRFAYTTLVVADVARAARFYERAFGFELGHAHDEGDYAELATGETRLAFASDELAATHWPFAYTPNRPAGAPPAVELTLVVGDVDSVFARAVEHGAAAVVAPTEKPWGRAAWVRDPDGILIQLASTKP
jgi:predicted enzyme related to lactoylglutathione lyase